MMSLKLAKAFGIKRGKEKNEEEERRVKIVAQIREDLWKVLNRKDSKTLMFICREDLVRIWSPSRIEQLSKGLYWSDPMLHARAREMFRKVMSILVWIGWGNWTEFGHLFLEHLGPENQLDRSDNKLPLEDTSFLPFEKFQSLFRDQQYIFTPIVIIEGDDDGDDEDDEVGYMQFSEKHRLPFLQTELVGEGAYGTVWREKIAVGHFVSKTGAYNTQPFFVARKCIRQRIIPKGTIGLRSFSEEKNLKSLKRCLESHRNIMRDYTSFTQGSFLNIISPLADLDLQMFFDGTYTDFSARSRRFNPASLLYSASCLASALSFLHEGLKPRGIAGKIYCAHLDLKPAHILVVWKGNSEPVGRWLVHGFGISNIKETPLSSIAASRYFLDEFSQTKPRRPPRSFQAPEIERVTEGLVGTQSDIWSLGCILAVVLAFALGGPSYVTRHADSRIQDSHNDYFYERKDNKITLKRKMVEWMESLRTDMKEETWIEDTLSLIYITLVEQQTARPSAKTFEETLIKICMRKDIKSLDLCCWVSEEASYVPKTFSGTVQLAKMTKSVESLDGITELVTHRPVPSDTGPGYGLVSMHNYPPQNELTKTTISSDRITDRGRQLEDSEMDRFLDDFESLDTASIRSLAPSNYSGSTLNGGTMADAEREIIDFFAADSVLKPLYLFAIARLDPDRFDRNLSRLLQQFSRDLQKEAEDEIQITVARLIRYRASSVAKALNPYASPTLQLQQPSHIDKSPTELLSMENWINSFSAQNKVSTSSQREKILDIAEEVEENAETPAKDLEVEPDDIFGDIERIRSFMNSSNALKLFRLDFRLFIFPVMRDYLSSTLEKICDSKAEILNLSGQVRWELMSYLQKEARTCQDLSSLLTVTGPPRMPRATSCGSYMCETWSNTGEKTLKVICEAITFGKSVVNYTITHKLQLRMDPPEEKLEQRESAEFQISGTLNEVVETLEQLSWVAAVFRIPCSGKLISSYVNFDIPPKVNELESELYCELSLFEPRPFTKSGLHGESLTKTVTDVLDGTCWTFLLKEAVLARGFSLPKRNGEKGLQLSFELMILLAGIHGVVEFGDGFALLGPKFALLPVKRTAKSIQWHLLGAEDLSTKVARMRITSKEHPTMDSPKLEFEDLHTLEPYLGYCSYAEIHLGTDSAAASHIKESISPISISRIEIAREATLTASFSIKSIFNIGGNLKMTLPRGIEVSITGTDIDYEDQVDRAIKQIVLFYDTAARRGWLVSELSVILHMIHAFFAQPDVRARLKPEVLRQNIFYAAPVAHGGEAARDAIKLANKLELWNRDEGGNPKRFMDVVKDYLNIFDIARKADQIQRSTSGYLISKSYPSGWEFVEMRDKKDRSNQRVLKDKTDSNLSWWQLSHHPDILTILGTEIGNPIRPNIAKFKACSAWTPVPENYDLLTASIYCVKELAKRCNSGRTCFRLTEKLMWHAPEGSSCFEECCTGNCIRIQELWSSDSKREKKPPFRRHAIIPPKRVESNGAVIFGNLERFSRDQLHTSRKIQCRELIAPTAAATLVFQPLNTEAELRRLEHTSSLLQKRSVIRNPIPERLANENIEKQKHRIAKDLSENITHIMPLQSTAIKTAPVEPILDQEQQNQTESQQWLGNDDGSSSRHSQVHKESDDMKTLAYLVIILFACLMIQIAS